MLHGQAIRWRGEPVFVSYHFTPGESGYTAGLPENCYPEQPPEFDIQAVRYQGVDVLPLLHDRDLDEIEQLLRNN